MALISSSSAPFLWKCLREGDGWTCAVGDDTPAFDCPVISGSELVEMESALSCLSLGLLSLVAGGNSDMLEPTLRLVLAPAIRALDWYFVRALSKRISRLPTLSAARKKQPIAGQSSAIGMACVVITPESTRARTSAVRTSANPSAWIGRRRTSSTPS